MEFSIGEFNIEGDQERNSEFHGLEASLSFAQDYFKNLDPFEPTSSMKEKCKNLDRVLRDIDTKMDRTNIVYLVTDKFFCNEKEKYLPMRLKGFFQRAGENKITEIQNSAYNYLRERYGWKINMDLVE